MVFVPVGLNSNDILGTNVPQEVGTAGNAGTADKAAREDHVHKVTFPVKVIFPLSAPASPVPGEAYFDVVTGKIMIYVE